jgi:hypothetical protein
VQAAQVVMWQPGDRVDEWRDWSKWWEGRKGQWGRKGVVGIENSTYLVVIIYCLFVYILWYTRILEVWPGIRAVSMNVQ